MTDRMIEKNPERGCEEFPNLLTPLTLRGLVLKNRMFSAPTSLAKLGENEHYSRENIDYYRYKAMGGCALVSVGDVIVDNTTGRSHPEQVGLDDSSHLPYLVKLADAIHSGGAAASVEIDHGGALCSPDTLGGRNPIGPSGYVDEWGDTVEEMTTAQIYEVAEAYGRAAKIAKDCGFDMVMIHAGHGWLIHQFISEVTNHRTDEWGGSFENRMRFALLVVEKVREAVGEQFPIEIRISGSERMQGGYDIRTGVEIAKALDGAVDLIHVSAGTQQDLYSFILMHPGAFQKHGENSHLAAEIKKHVSTPVVTVGAWNDPVQMEAFLQEGKADGIAMGRALLADPFLPRKVTEGRIDEIRPCLRCGQCQGGMMENKIMRCSINPVIGRESDALHPLPHTRHGKVMIVGGGPGGMHTAIKSAQYGNETVLYEKRKKLGGALKFAEDTGFKKTMYHYRSYLDHMCRKLPIRIVTGTEVTPEIVREESPDLLVIATGAKPVIPPIPGADLPHVLIGADVMNSTERDANGDLYREKVGHRVAVIGGGMIGCELAVLFARKGHEVALIEMRDEVAADCVVTYRINLMHQIEKESGIRIYARASCKEITPTEVRIVVQNDAGEEILAIPADTVLMSAGMRSDEAAYKDLLGIVAETVVIGDAKHAGRVQQATADAKQVLDTFMMDME